MIYVLLADGFEEVEAIAPIDVMRRNDITVATAGVGGNEICGAHGIIVKTDMLVEDIDVADVEGIILPGGMPGTTNLQKDEYVNTLIKYCEENELLIAAICAAPMILGELGMLEGKEAVCFPGFEENLHGADVCDCAVAVCDNIITARGAGAALEFGAAIVDYFSGEAGAGEATLDIMQYPL
ncbi:MAG: DJ-1 family glyoxalase III [Clostridia bacterium]|nr:DJ-1 family glyoxalase III [Clostridia bacterium]